MMQIRNAAIMGLCLATCACGVHGPAAKGGDTSLRPAVARPIDDGRWRGRGIWTPIVTLPGTPMQHVVAMLSQEGGPRVVRALPTGYDIWAVSLDCASGRASFFDSRHAASDEAPAIGHATVGHLDLMSSDVRRACEHSAPGRIEGGPAAAAAALRGIKNTAPRAPVSASSISDTDRARMRAEYEQRITASHKP